MMTHQLVLLLPLVAQDVSGTLQQNVLPPLDLRLVSSLRRQTNVLCRVVVCTRRRRVSGLQQKTVDSACRCKCIGLAAEKGCSVPWYSRTCDPARLAFSRRYRFMCRYRVYLPPQRIGLAPEKPFRVSPCHSAPQGTGHAAKKKGLLNAVVESLLGARTGLAGPGEGERKLELRAGVGRSAALPYRTKTRRTK